MRRRGHRDPHHLPERLPGAAVPSCWPSATTSRCSATAAASATRRPGSPTSTRSWRPPTSRPGAWTDRREALTLGRRYDAVIAPFAGGALLPAAYAGARRYRKPFVLWASIWHQPRSAAHAVALPSPGGSSATPRRCWPTASTSGGSSPRSAAATPTCSSPPSRSSPSCSGARSSDERGRGVPRPTGSADGPLVLYAGRLVPEKGVEVIAQAWPAVRADATLVVVGDGPLAARVAGLPAHPRARARCPAPSSRSPTPPPRSRCCPRSPRRASTSPGAWSATRPSSRAGPMIATTAVGAVAGGLVRDGETGARRRARRPAALALDDRSTARRRRAARAPRRRRPRSRPALHLRRHGRRLRPRAGGGCRAPAHCPARASCGAH